MLGYQLIRAFVQATRTDSLPTNSVDNKWPAFASYDSSLLLFGLDDQFPSALTDLMDDPALAAQASKWCPFIISRCHIET